MALIRFKAIGFVQSYDRRLQTLSTWFRYQAGRWARDASGQSTVEYAVVLAASMAMVLGLGALWKLGAQGRLQELAEQAASHVVQSLGGFRDILLF